MTDDDLKALLNRFEDSRAKINALPIVTKQEQVNSLGLLALFLIPVMLLASAIGITLSATRHGRD